VSNLEAQVEKLTRENRELKSQTRANSVNSENTTSLETRNEVIKTSTETPTASGEQSNHLDHIVKSVRHVVVEPSRQPRFLGQSSGITLAKLVMAAIKVDTLPTPTSMSPEHSYDNTLSAPAPGASFPPRHAADHLVDVYFRYRTPHLPIIERSQVEESVENAYLYMNGSPPSDRVVERDMFITYMIFAIALCDVPSPGGGRPSQSEGCFQSAIGYAEKVITYSKSDIETLRAILFLAQFVALCPSRGSLWHLAGTALRLCIDIGLHWETEEQSINLEPEVLHERRRLWYATYQFDRVLCITLGRPFGIIEESTRVPLPNPWINRRGLGREPFKYDVHNQRAHNHLFSMSKLESEIRHVLHNQTWAPKLAYPRVNFQAWIQDIHPRLQEWYTTVPQPNKAHPSSIFSHQAYWDTIYYSAILLLYRPHSEVQHLSDQVLFISFEASCKLIASIKVLQRERKIDIMWKSVHQLFMAGLGVIYSLWHSKEIRAQNPVSKCISTLQSCALTLTALSESFQGAAGCRDTFDVLTAATVDWLVTADTEQERRKGLEFEKQVKELLNQFQPSRDAASEVNADGMSAIFSADNFSEMLSYAAQWPEFPNMNFDDMGSDNMIETGYYNF
jgi:hypothetical protein